MFSPSFIHNALGLTDITYSVSAPAFAALIALLNDHRHGEGRPSMGFLNPWIYSIGNDAFTEYVGSRLPLNLFIILEYANSGVTALRSPSQLAATASACQVLNRL